MDIASVASSSILQTGLFANTGVQSVTFAIDTPATTGASNLDSVDISGLGRLLSAASLFESGILQSTADSQTGFATLATATQFFADAFNSYLQSGFDNTQSSSGGSLGSLFVQLLDSRLNMASDNGASIISRLSDIGINFQSPSTQSDTAQMTIDFQSLQSAFTADQTGTTSLLTQATQSIALLASEFSSTLVQLENLAQTDASQSSLVTAVSNGAPATTTELATTTQATTALAEATAAPPTAQPTAPAPLSATASPTTTAAGSTSIQTTTELPSATTQATAALAETTAAATTAQPTPTVQPTVTAPLPATASPTTTATGSAPAQTNTELPSVATQATAALAEATAAAATAQPTPTQTAATALLPATGSPTTTETGSTPAQTTTALPAATAPLELATTAIATEIPTASGLPTTTTTPLTASVATIAQNAIPLNFVNPIINASDPAVAAAISAYHLVDGIFDTGRMHIERPPPTLDRDSEIWPVAQIRPVKLDLYA